MDRLDQIAVFLEVARHESFRAAAQSLRISKSAASRAVGLLEDRLKVRLLDRTTRSVRLTAAGQEYRGRVQPAFEALHETDARMADQAQRIAGRLRIGAGVTLCEEQLVPLLPEFLTRYPDVTLEFIVSDRQVDLIGEGLDCAIRVAHLDDSTLVTRRLASSTHVLCASPGYLERAGRPSELADLGRAQLVVDGNQHPVWRLRKGQVTVEHRPQRRLVINSGQAVRRAVLADMGIALSPTFIVGEDLRAGRLVRVLEHVDGPAVPISLLHPSRRFVPPALRAWVDFVAEAWVSPPWEAWRAAV